MSDYKPTIKRGRPLAFAQETGDPIKDRITLIKMENSLSYRQMGELLGVTHAAVVDWITGRRKPSGSLMAHLIDKSAP
jgi:DNA-binding transcriptional regulator YiaG